GRGSPSMLNSIRPFNDRRYAATSWASARVMCRSSARGWTVMLGAPASTHTLTASSTDGTVPPRELRTVATLLTLTESFVAVLAILHVGDEVLFDRVGDLIRPRRNLALVLPFDHDAQQRLGARVANQQPPVARQPRL